MVAAPEDEIPLPSSSTYDFFEQCPVSHSVILPLSLSLLLNCVQARVVNVFYSTSIRPEDAMIHLTVPDTQVLVEKNDGISKYTVSDLLFFQFPAFLGLQYPCQWMVPYRCQVQSIVGTVRDYKTPVSLTVTVSLLPSPHSFSVYLSLYLSTSRSVFNEERHLILNASSSKEEISKFLSVSTYRVFLSLMISAVFWR